MSRGSWGGGGGGICRARERLWGGFVPLTLGWLWERGASQRAAIGCRDGCQAACGVFMGRVAAVRHCQLLPMHLTMVDFSEKCLER